MTQGRVTVTLFHTILSFENSEEENLWKHWQKNRNTSNKHLNFSKYIFCPSKVKIDSLIHTLFVLWFLKFNYIMICF